MNPIYLYRAEAERMSSCGSKGFVVTGVGIQCPTLLQGATEITEIYFSCRIEIQVGDYRSWHSPSGGGIDKIEMTCSVKPNGLTEVPINPPVLLPSGLGKGVRITAQVQNVLFLILLTGVAVMFACRSVIMNQLTVIQGDSWPQQGEKVGTEVHTFEVPESSPRIQSKS